MNAGLEPGTASRRVQRAHVGGSGRGPEDAGGPGRSGAGDGRPRQHACGASGSGLGTKGVGCSASRGNPVEWVRSAGAGEGPHRGGTATGAVEGWGTDENAHKDPVQRVNTCVKNKRIQRSPADSTAKAKIPLLIAQQRPKKHGMGVALGQLEMLRWGRGVVRRCRLARRRHRYAHRQSTSALVITVAQARCLCDLVQQPQDTDCVQGGEIRSDIPMARIE